MLQNDETFAEEETLQSTSRISAWPEKLIDFEDLGNSEDDDGFPDSFSDNRIRRRKDQRVNSAPVRKSKTIPTPFKMTIRLDKNCPLNASTIYLFRKLIIILNVQLLNT